MQASPAKSYSILCSVSEARANINREELMHTACWSVACVSTVQAHVAS